MMSRELWKSGAVKSNNAQDEVQGRSSSQMLIRHSDNIPSDLVVQQAAYPNCKACNKNNDEQMVEDEEA